MALPTSVRPPIRLSIQDAEQLMALGLQAALSSPQDVNLLLAEVERAELLREQSQVCNAVALGSIVEFTDGTGVRTCVEIVVPTDADTAAGRISVLSNIGAGLIGLRAGQTILWPDAAGRERPLTVLSVTCPAACSSSVAMLAALPER